MRLSKFTLFLSIYIVISSFFMQEVWLTWKAIFGVNRLILFFILLCIVTIAAILYKNIKSGFNLIKMVFPNEVIHRGKSSGCRNISFLLVKIGIICVICTLGFIFALRQPYLSEKAHVLEFGLLGWLVMRDLTRQNRNLLKSILAGIIFVTTIGCLEEGFQKLLPWRVFEIRDIATDLLSGMLGIALNFLSQTGLSSFVRPF